MGTIIQHPSAVGAADRATSRAIATDLDTLARDLGTVVDCFVRLRCADMSPDARTGLAALLAGQVAARSCGEAALQGGSDPLDDWDWLSGEGRRMIADALASAAQH